jgi:prolipoprotein diacylglyceryltransferase/protein-S-isoprenylcysteine O-methyltransferase Ste14
VPAISQAKNQAKADRLAPHAEASPTRVIGKVLYAFIFVVLLPVGLFAWAHAAAPNVLLPPVHSVALGGVAAIAGGILLAWGVVSLGVYGRGLPMNAYPPPRFVSRGAYGLLRHPIYVGFVLVCVGWSFYTGSASGLWLVCPVVSLGCAALVFGYENIDLRHRFADPWPQPSLRLPVDEDIVPEFADRLSIYFLVLLPWAALYGLLSALGTPLDAVSGFLAWERKLPVLEWTEALYAGTYLLVILVPWVATTRRALRQFAVQGLAGTLFMVLCFAAVPVIAPPRPFTSHTILGQLLVLERQLDTPTNAFPSYHVFWALLAVSVFAARMPRWRAGWWALGAAVSMSCLTTGTHSLADVLAGVLLFLVVKNLGAIWESLRRLTERIANSWKEWRWGPVRIINHGLYAGVGAGVAVAIVGSLIGSRNGAAILLVALVGLVAAGLWAQFVEGSPSLLRPYGYYGGVLGIILGSLLAGPLFGTDPWLPLAAYSVAGPWVQSFGRLRCLVQGCCHGRESSAALGIVYRHSRSRVCRLTGLQGVPVHPTPLYSILWNVVTAVAMTRLWSLHSSLALIGGLYLVLTGLGRFVEEAYRGEPQTRVIAGLRLYQWLALLTVLAGAIVTCVRTAPAPWTFEPSGSTLALAAAFGVITCFALGVDFPESNRRFARLA